MIAFFSGIWGKLILGAAIVAALGFFLYKVYKAGGDATRIETERKNLRHIIDTAKEITNADKNLNAPGGPRARRVRDLFTRRDGA